jgi:hypothetical protein
VLYQRVLKLIDETCCFCGDERPRHLGGHRNLERVDPLVRQPRALADCERDFAEVSVGITSPYPIGLPQAASRHHVCPDRSRSPALCYQLLKDDSVN